MAKKYKLNKEDGGSILKVLAYAGASAIIAALITIIPEVEIPGGVAFLIPVINAALYSAKKFFEAE